MPQQSAGILAYRRGPRGLEMLLVHPGGPYWRRRDEGAWQIPKGGIEAGEAPVDAARREFEEELGVRPKGAPQPLMRIRQSGGKWVVAFALEQNLDPDAIVSSRFEIEWPPRSGRLESFPEVDRAAWFTPSAARGMILSSQAPLIDALLAMVDDQNAFR